MTETYAPMTVADAKTLRDDLDKQGKKLVFTNGCFDLLHTGHVRYLQQARALGDALVIGLNADSSVRELKGPSRPINRERDRAEVLAGLRCVDGVVVFADKRATSLIEQIKPHIYAKGGDYTPESLDPEERKALDSAGSEIHILSLIAGRSTTRIIERMTQGGESKPPLKLGILGSGAGSNLKALIQSIENLVLDAQIVTTLTDKETSGFHQIAKDAGLSAQVLSLGKDGKTFDEKAQKKAVELLQKAKVDVVVLTGFMRILKKPFLDAFRDRIINVHPSLLPAYKGANAVQDALDEGELETGCTVHIVTAEVDAGRILAKAKVPILIGDTAEELHRRIKQQEHRLLPEVLSDWKRP